jgi:sigma-B regulation protein RsbU (phosphoserine phosphatase)
MAYVNNLLFLESVASMFVTVFYGILNVKIGELQYSNAGHNPPYIVQSDGSIKVTELTGGLPLGILDGVSYQSTIIKLQKGETFFLYTDGVTEAMDVNENLYSEEKLMELIKNKNSTPIDALVHEVFNSVHEYSKDVQQSDDITVLVLRFLGK